MSSVPPRDRPDDEIELRDVSKKILADAELALAGADPDDPGEAKRIAVRLFLSALRTDVPDSLC